MQYRFCMCFRPKLSKNQGRLVNRQSNMEDASFFTLTTNFKSMLLIGMDVNIPVFSPHLELFLIKILILLCCCCIAKYFFVPNGLNTTYSRVHFNILKIFYFDNFLQKFISIDKFEINSTYKHCGFFFLIDPLSLY